MGRALCYSHVLHGELSIVAWQLSMSLDCLSMGESGFNYGLLSVLLASLVVSCPASLSHVEKESGETCIQFWFPMYLCDAV